MHPPLPKTWPKDGDGDIVWEVRRSGVPPETVEKMRLGTWDAFREGCQESQGLEEALEAVGAMIRGQFDFTCLTLAGTPGSGKTHLALAVAWEWIEAGAYVIYFRAQVLMDRLRGTFDLTPQIARALHERTLEEEIDLLESCHLLIIDDLGAEKATEWTDAVLDRIIDTRWLKELPLIVTTNVKSSGLPPRIVDRLKDRRIGRVITMVASSYRSGEFWHKTP